MARRLRELSSIDIVEGCLSMDKEAPLDHELRCDVAQERLQDAIVFLIDDVLNSGRTLIHGVQHLLMGKPREIHTAVLVDRKHRSFPIRADLCGLTLCTQLTEHIAVDLSTPTTPPFTSNGRTLDIQSSRRQRMDAKASSKASWVSSD